jgi:hypothetical protein
MGEGVMFQIKMMFYPNGAATPIEGIVKAHSIQGLIDNAKNTQLQLEQHYGTAESISYENLQRVQLCDPSEREEFDSGVVA